MRSEPVGRTPTNRRFDASLRHASRVLIMAMMIMTVAFVAGPAGNAAPQKANELQPGVSDGQSPALNAEGLSQTPPRFVSGLRPVTMTSQYTTIGTEVINCPEHPTAPPKIFWTRNGTDPGTTTSADTFEAELTTPEQCTPSQDQTFRHEFPLTELALVNSADTITFRMVIPSSGSPSGEFQDNNGGLFYKFRIDRSAPQLVDIIPTPPRAGASIPDAVTNNQRTSISFRVTDDPTEAKLAPASLAISIDGVVQTGNFTCGTSDFVFACAFDYSKFPATFAWADGTHTVTVAARDEAFNQVATNTFRFRIDKVAPVVGNVTGVPNTSVAGTGGALPTTARGVNVTVNADVGDPNIDTTSTRLVFAQLVNETRGLASPVVPLRFTSGQRWTANNVTIPATWPAETFNVSVKVIASDLAANAGVGFSPPAFTLDPTPPSIADVYTGGFVNDQGFTVRAEVKDAGTGLDAATVRIFFLNTTGNFKAPPTGTTRVGLFHTAAMTRAGGDNFTYNIPPAQSGAVIVYFIEATDRAGGKATSSPRAVKVDTTPPLLTEIDPKPFRSKSPYTFRLQATDEEAGVNHSTVKIFVGTGGAFAPALLSREGFTPFYSGPVTVTVADAATVSYYFEATDTAGNLGVLNSSAAPRTFKVDLRAPTFTLDAPASSSGPTFPLTWSGTDEASGIDSYTLQARAIGNGTTSPWITILNATTTTSLDVCGAGGYTYEFRGFATDKAGNNGTLPAAAMKSTVLSGAGCKEEVRITIVSPTGGALDASETPKSSFRWSARSTLTLTPSSALVIDLDFSPDDGANFFPLARGIPNSGVREVNLTDLPTCTNCVFRVTATTISGATATGSSPSFEIRKGSETVDLDEDGMPDAWEVRFGETLDSIDPAADDDDDGLDNGRESVLGTNPNAKDTDGDGASDGAEARSGTNPLSPASVPTRAQLRSEQFTNWYWVVPGIFVALSVIFFVGLARRY